MLKVTRYGSILDCLVCDFLLGRDFLKSNYGLLKLNFNVQKHPLTVESIAGCAFL
ncbi:hypothetical protein Syun_007073 [Stephania yunnanensis]|uniref:Uncharacterized protein n=1 Tax=Stephania yunnanensis TaxID=152371 RepID=A0AAP0PY70_9MAGN